MMPAAAFFRFFRLALIVLAGMLAAGCAAPGRIGTEADLTSFQRTGRFAISVSMPGNGQDAVQGGFAWLDRGNVLTLDLANPLGSTLARIVVNKQGAELTRSNGARDYAPHPDALVEKVLGTPVPVVGLRHWMRGQVSAGAQEVQTDAKGRISAFMQDGWRVRLSRYDDRGPALLQLNRHDAQRDISVRLAVTAQAGAQ